MSARVRGYNGLSGKKFDKEGTKGVKVVPQSFLAVLFVCLFVLLFVCPSKVATS